MIHVPIRKESIIISYSKEVYHATDLQPMDLTLCVHYTEILYGEIIKKLGTEKRAV